MTEVPPAAGPEAGEMLVTVGGTPVYKYWSAVEVALVTPLVVTVTSTVPPVGYGGALTLIWLPPVSEKEAVAATVPNMTVDALVNPVPFMVTGLFPLLSPCVGVRPVTVGVNINDAFIECDAITFVNM